LAFSNASPNKKDFVSSKEHESDEVSMLLGDTKPKNLEQEMKKI